MTTANEWSKPQLTSDSLNLIPTKHLESLMTVTTLLQNTIFMIYSHVKKLFSHDSVQSY